MANIELRLSTGSSSNTTVTSPRASLGGRMAEAGSGGTSHFISPNVFAKNNIWDDITASENLNQKKEYRCLYIHNAPGGASEGDYLSASLYLVGSTYAKYKFAKAASKNSTAATVSTEGIAPSGMSFAPADKDNKLVLGDLAPGDYIYVWVERQASNITGSGTTQEVFSLAIDGAE